MFTQRKNIRKFIQHLIERFPDSVNKQWRYILFFKDVINGYAFTLPYLYENKYQGRVILNIPRILKESNCNIERFTSLVLINLYHETEHTFQFEYMKKNDLDIRKCLKNYYEQLEEQAKKASKNLKYDYNFSYIK